MIGMVRFRFGGAGAVATLGGRSASWAVTGVPDPEDARLLERSLNAAFSPIRTYRGPADGAFGWGAVAGAAEFLRGAPVFPPKKPEPPGMVY